MPMDFSPPFKEPESMVSSGEDSDHSASSQKKRMLQPSWARGFPYGEPWKGHVPQLDLGKIQFVPDLKDGFNKPLQFYTPRNGVLDPNYIVFTPEVRTSLEEAIRSKLMTIPDASSMMITEISNVIAYGMKTRIYGPLIPWIKADNVSPYQLGTIFHPAHLYQCSGIWFPIFKKVNGKGNSQTTNIDQQEPISDNRYQDGGGGGSQHHGPQQPQQPKATPSILLISTHFLMMKQADVYHKLMKDLSPEINDHDTHVLGSASLQNLSFFTKVRMPAGTQSHEIQNLKYVDPAMQEMLEDRAGYQFTNEHSAKVINNHGGSKDEARMFANLTLLEMGYPPGCADEGDFLYMFNELARMDTEMGKATFRYPDALVSSMEHYMDVTY